MKTLATYIHTCCSKLLKSSFFAFLILPLFISNAFAAGCNVSTFASLVPPGDAQDITVDSATLVPASTGVPEYCNIFGRLDKNATSVIHFEMTLPDQSGWNGKMLMLGGGGFDDYYPSFTNSIDTHPSFNLVYPTGYAIIGTDGGNNDPNGTGAFLLNNPLALKNFGYRAAHLGALTGKIISKAFYGAQPSYAYFDGTSKGGQEGMMEAERYPSDFKGIIAGAAVIDVPDLFMDWATNEEKLFPSNPQTSVGVENKLALIQSAALAKCDALDGIKDGIISNWSACHFNPKSDIPSCHGNVDGPNCLTTAQANAVNQIYNGISLGPVQLYPGYLPGGENNDYFGEGAGWAVWITGFPGLPAYFYGDGANPDGVPSIQYSYASQAMGYIFFQNPNFVMQNFNINNLLQVLTVELYQPIFNAANPNLAVFKSLGGKLILWHGTYDAASSPMTSINYYNALTAVMGGTQSTMNFARLFLAPGAGHGGGGVGPYPTDIQSISVLDNWVRNGIAPTYPNVSNFDGSISRPLCAYPQVAVLNKGLDATNPIITNNAANFHCANSFDNWNN